MKMSKKHHVFFIRYLFLCYWLYVNRLGVALLVSYDVGRLRCSFPITLAQTGFFSPWHCPPSVAPLAQTGMIGTAHQCQSCRARAGRAGRFTNPDTSRATATVSLKTSDGRYELSSLRSQLE